MLTSPAPQPEPVPTPPAPRVPDYEKIKVLPSVGDTVVVCCCNCVADSRPQRVVTRVEMVVRRETREDDNETRVWVHLNEPVVLQRCNVNGSEEPLSCVDADLVLSLEEARKE